jgi:hypothetical protein
MGLRKNLSCLPTDGRCGEADSTTTGMHLEELLARHHRHEPVEHDHPRGGMPGQPLHCIFPVGGHRHLKTVGFQTGYDTSLDVAIVVDHQHVDRGCRLHQLLDSRSTERGRSTVNVAPCPTALFTRMVPPMLSTRLLAIHSPSPKPLKLVTETARSKR